MGKKEVSMRQREEFVQNVVLHIYEIQRIILKIIFDTRSY